MVMTGKLQQIFVLTDSTGQNETVVLSKYVLMTHVVTRKSPHEMLTSGPLCSIDWPEVFVCVERMVFFYVSELSFEQFQIMCRLR